MSDDSAKVAQNLITMEKDLFLLEVGALEPTWSLVEAAFYKGAAAGLRVHDKLTARPENVPAMLKEQAD